LTLNNTKKVFFGDKFFYVSEGVYEPAEDTYLLAENLEVQPNDLILEIGAGCGILSVLSALTAIWVVALDISPHAVRCSKLNAKINDISEKIDIIRGDLFGPLSESELFDLIILNAPYLPTESDEPKGWLEYAWEGGKNGRRLIDRFISSVSVHLKPGGRILLVQSTLSDVNETVRNLKEHSFNVRIISEHRVAFETIALIEAVKPEGNDKKLNREKA